MGTPSGLPAALLVRCGMYFPLGALTTYELHTTYYRRPNANAQQGGLRAGGGGRESGGLAAGRATASTWGISQRRSWCMFLLPRSVHSCKATPAAAHRWPMAMRNTRCGVCRACFMRATGKQHQVLRSRGACNFYGMSHRLRLQLLKLPATGAEAPSNAFTVQQKANEPRVGCLAPPPWPPGGRLKKPGSPQ
jgi:hypothetical protein